MAEATATETIEVPDYEKQPDDWFDTSIPVAPDATPEPETVPTPEVQGEAQQPGNEQPSPPAEPPSDAPTQAADVPAYLANIPADERRAIAESILNDLPRDERAKLGPIDELLQSTRQSEGQRVRNEIQDQLSANNRRTQAQQHAISLQSRLEAGEVNDYQAELTNYFQVATGIAYEQVGEQMSGVLGRALASMGLKEWPQETLQQAQGARSLVQAFETYIGSLIAQAKAEGSKNGRADYEKADRAANTLNRERIRNEYLAELDKEGRLKDSTPPILGNGSVVTAEVSEEEFLQAMSSSAAMDALPPEKQAQIRSLMVQAMGGQ